MGQLDPELMKGLMEVTEKELTPKQAKIVQAAIEIFSEKGFAATSTSEIAKRAGVAEGTIFRHYKTKKDLLISIVIPVISKLAVPFLAEKFLNEVFQEGNYSDMDKLLKTLIVNRFDFVRKNVPLIRIMMQEMAYHPELQENFKKVFVEKSIPRFRKAIEKLQADGHIVSDFPVEVVIRLTITTIVGFLIARFLIMPDFQWDDEKEIEYTIQFIRNGLNSTPTSHLNPSN